MSRPIPIRGYRPPLQLARDATPLVFIQINVVDMDRAEFFYNAVFRWHFIPGPISTSPDNAKNWPTPDPLRQPPPNYDVRYFTKGRHDHIILGGIFQLRNEEEKAARADPDNAEKAALAIKSRPSPEPQDLEKALLAPYPVADPVVSTAKPMIINYIGVDSVDIAVERIISVGGKIVKPKWKVESNLFEMALFTDLENNTFGLVNDKHIRF